MIPIFSPRSRFFVCQIQIFHFNWVAGLCYASVGLAILSFHCFWSLDAFSASFVKHNDTSSNVSLCCFFTQHHFFFFIRHSNWYEMIQTNCFIRFLCFFFFTNPSSIYLVGYNLALNDLYWWRWFTCCFSWILWFVMCPFSINLFFCLPLNEKLLKKNWFICGSFTNSLRVYGIR